MLCRLFEGTSYSDDADVTLCFRLCRLVFGYSGSGGIPAHLALEAPFSWLLDYIARVTLPVEKSAG